MNSEKIGNFIKELRKKNNLTQQDLAKKYNVTYQAVSKWENGKNLPDISLIRQMSKDFNISIDDMLDGEISNNKKSKTLFIVFVVLVLIVLVLALIIKKIESNTFEFKTITTTCDIFNVSGSIAYDKEKSSIYISNINYCGGDDDNVYGKIECNLYESNENINTKISSCNAKENVTLEKYLKDVKLNIDNYAQKCKKYNDNSLYLEINASDDGEHITTYKIPLKLNDNCPN